MRFLVTGLLSLLMGQPLLATVINVPNDAPTIQAGINMAQNGDIVQVLAGVYSGDGNTNIDFHGKRVHLRSIDGPEVTIIHPDPIPGQDTRVFVFHSYELFLTKVEGFTIMGGHAEFDGGAARIEDSSPEFENCRFIDNTGHHGGACYITGTCRPRFFDCLFRNNSCGDVGGAVLCRMHANALFVDCVFENNSARNGALLCYDASPTINNCRFINNHTTSTGGAIFLQDNCSPQIKECLFINNTCGGNGGALYVNERGNVGGQCKPTLVNCTFSGNSANRGAAIFCNGFGGPAIPQCENGILAFNYDSRAVYVYNETYGVPTFSCSDIYGNPEGDWTDEIIGQMGANGNLSDDPMFCDTTAWDFNISAMSPCAPMNNSCMTLIGAMPVGCTSTNARMRFEPNPISCYMANTLDNMPVIIYVGGIEDDHEPIDIDCNSVNVNNILQPVAVEYLEYGLYYPTAIKITCSMADFIGCYGMLWDTTSHIVTVSGNYVGKSDFQFTGRVTMIGHISGDANSDRTIDIGDPVFILNYIFRNGRLPVPYEAGDANADGVVDVGDMVFLISHIFRNGPPPVKR